MAGSAVLANEVVAATRTATECIAVVVVVLKAAENTLQLCSVDFSFEGPLKMAECQQMSSTEVVHSRSQRTEISNKKTDVLLNNKSNKSTRNLK